MAIKGAQDCLVEIKAEAESFVSVLSLMVGDMDSMALEDIPHHIDRCVLEIKGRVKRISGLADETDKKYGTTIDE